MFNHFKIKNIKMKQIITHFTDNDLYTFTCMFYVLQNYPRAEVEYSFFDRNKTKYPKGFAELLREQMDNMANVVITDEEIAYMEKMCTYLPKWFINTFLKGFRFKPNEVTISQDEEGYLDVKVNGKWWSAIIWEMPILSTISELSHILNGDTENYNLHVEELKTQQKANKALSNGLFIGDMGTRRRFSFEHQEMVVKTFSEVSKKGENVFSGKFTGTSNVFLAMKYNLVPIGTMSHQIISFEENVSGLFECNYSVMNNWSKTFDGNVGIYLYDTFTDAIFFNNLSKRLAKTFDGLRVDSGKEEEQVVKIIDKYKSLGIDPREKQVVFSNGLDIDRAIELHNYSKGKVKDSYGIGTYLTCDVDNCQPMNIVVKLTKSRITEYREWGNCIKLSNDKGKTLGDKRKCDYILSLLN